MSTVWCWITELVMTHGINVFLFVCCVRTQSLVIRTSLIEWLSKPSKVSLLVLDDLFRPRTDISKDCLIWKPLNSAFHNPTSTLSSNEPLACKLCGNYKGGLAWTGSVYALHLHAGVVAIGQTFSPPKVEYPFVSGGPWVVWWWHLIVPLQDLITVCIPFSLSLSPVSVAHLFSSYLGRLVSGVILTAYPYHWVVVFESFLAIPVLFAYISVCMFACLSVLLSGAICSKGRSCCFCSCRGKWCLRRCCSHHSCCCCSDSYMRQCYHLDSD